MIPVIAGIAMERGIDSTALYFGLLSGATLGGNCTPIGASANITGIGILRKEGHDVTNGDFFKIGIPFTLSAIVPAYILIWSLCGVLAESIPTVFPLHSGGSTVGIFAFWDV